MRGWRLRLAWATVDSLEERYQLDAIPGGITTLTLSADGKVVVQATFNEPGNYVLRSLADDGALLGGDSVTVTVTR